LTKWPACPNIGPTLAICQNNHSSTFARPGIFRRQETADLLRQMHQYRARLENRDIGVAIDNRGNLAVSDKSSRTPA